MRKPKCKICGEEHWGVCARPKPAARPSAKKAKAKRKAKRPSRPTVASAENRIAGLLDASGKLPPVEITPPDLRAMSVALPPPPKPPPKKTGRPRIYHDDRPRPDRKDYMREFMRAKRKRLRAERIAAERARG